MSGSRPERKEDRLARILASTLEQRGKDLTDAFCREIAAMPEIAELKRDYKITDVEWYQFIATLAGKALHGEHVESVVHAFNRTYAFKDRPVTSRKRTIRH